MIMIPYWPYVELRTEKDLHEEITSLEETQLLYMPENQFGIYQIDPEGNARGLHVPES